LEKFFQGFDFGMATYNEEQAVAQMTHIATDNLQSEPGF
jgi:hypothetical protein